MSVVKLSKSKNTGKRAGQALVEFALTAMVFLLLLMLIIEIAHLMQAFVTIQHAARVGARYAVTGQAFEQYEGNPDAQSAHWDIDSNDPLAHIPPCWPRFYDDAYAPTANVTEDADKLAYYEPYRDARTCSVEQVTLQAMPGLNLLTDKSADSPDWYLDDAYLAQPESYWIRVQGVHEDPTPQDGQFQRKNSSEVTEDVDYSTYYGSNPDWDDDTANWVTGYAGRPLQKVRVLVLYRVKVITPLLQPIAPSILLRGSAIMTNEAFGSTNLGTEAVQPPEMPPIDDPALPQPPDLVIDDFIIDFVGDPDAGVPVDFKVTIRNDGGTVLENTSFTTTLYYFKDGDQPDPLDTLTPGDGTLLGSETASPVIPGNYEATIPGTFPDAGVYHVYAYADSANDIIEDTNGFDIFPYTEGIHNTAWLAGTVTVSSVADLEVTKEIDDDHPLLGQPIEYTITLAHTATSNVDATGITLTDSLLNQLDYVSSSATAGSVSYDGVSRTITWEGGLGLTDLPVVITINATVNPGASIGVYTDPTETLTLNEDDPDLTNNIGDPGPINIGMPNLAITKEITDIASGESVPQESDTITYTITVINNDDDVANNIVLVDTLPDQWITFNSANPVPDSHVGDVLTWNLAPIPPAGSVIVEVVINTDAGSSGQTITNTARVEISGQLIAEDDDTTTIAGPPDIAVTKVVSDSTPVAGDDIYYIITAKNIGDTAATNIIINDLLPSDVTYTGHSTTGPSSTYDETTGVWEISSLDDSDQATLHIDVRVNPDAPESAIVNTAALDLATVPSDSNASNNSDIATITPQWQADLAISKTLSVNGGPAGDLGDGYPDDTVLYTVIVTNAGPSDATDIEVTEIALVDAVADGALTYDYGGTSWTTGTSFDLNAGVWQIPSLAIGESATLTVQATITGPATGGEINNQALIVSLDQDDPDTSDNASDEVTLVVNWPRSIFVNVGDQGHSPCNVPQSWGHTEDELGFEDRSWAPNQRYDLGIGNDWGYFGSNYQRKRPSNNWTVIDSGGAVLNSDGLALFGCRMYGRDFSYRFDNMLPGSYRLYTLFADPFHDPGERRFNMTFTNDSGTSTIASLFDIARYIEDVLGLTPSRVEQPGPDLAHYAVRSFDVTIGASGSVTLRLIGNQLGDGYSDVNAMIMGVGLEFLTP